MSTKQDRDYTEALVATTRKLIADGVTDPSAEQIAHAHFPDQPIGGEIVEGVRKKLTKIRDSLEATDGMPVYLVRDVYYKRFRNRGKEPSTGNEARLCLPLGHGIKAQGVRLHSGDDDLIWAEWIGQNSSTGGGKMKKVYDRVVAAVETGSLSDEHAAKILHETAEKMRPEQPELAQDLFDRALALEDDKPPRKKLKP